MLPIIFIHNRNNDYLPLSLWKARETNPNADIILLGDGQNAHFGTITHHHYSKNFFKIAGEFAKTFQNFSSNPSDFELICLQRWMILEEFLMANKIDKCLYIDSDVLLFDTMEPDAERFKEYGMTVAGISGHTNFINGTSCLSEFCEYIRKSYANEAAIEKLRTKYAAFCKTHTAGGISDMTFFTEFRNENPGKVLDIGEPISGKMFDITITYTKGVKKDAEIKKLEWIEEKPYIELTEGQKIEMRSLHFQGASKKYMVEMAQLDSQTLKTIYFLNKGYILLQKIWNKLSGKR